MKEIDKTELDGECCGDCKFQKDETKHKICTKYKKILYLNPSRYGHSRTQECLDDIGE